MNIIKNQKLARYNKKIESYGFKIYSIDRGLINKSNGETLKLI